MTLSMVLVWAAGIALTAIVVWFYPGHDGDTVEPNPVITPSLVDSQAAEATPDAPATPAGLAPDDGGADGPGHPTADVASTIVQPPAAPQSTGSEAAKAVEPAKPARPVDPAKPAQPAPSVPKGSAATRPVAQPGKTPGSPADSTPTTPDEDPPLAPPSW